MLRGCAWRSSWQSHVLAAGVFCLLAATAYADWETAANARIEQHRKRDVVLTIENGRTGRPLVGVEISAKQIGHHFGFGSEIGGTNLWMEEDYATFFLENFQWATMSNVRWGHHERERGQVNYERSDRLLEFLQANGIKIRGHHIFNTSGEREWLRAIVDRRELFEAMQNRITDVVTRYKGQFEHWDVNNEMLQRSHYKSTVPYAMDGSDDPIRVWMFRRARELDPDVKLFVNETAIVGSHPDFMRFRDPAIALVRELIDQGAPVDGLGIQGHVNTGFDRDIVVANFEALKAAGVPIWATEFHVQNTDVSARADDIEDFYRIAFSMPHVGGIIMWGFWGETTITHPWPNAGLVSTDGVLNEAGHRYRALLDEWTTDFVATTDDRGQISFRGFHGTYRISGADFEPVTIEIEPGDAAKSATVKLLPSTDVTDHGATAAPTWTESAVAATAW